MWIELPNLWIILLNVIGVPLAHLTLAWISTILPTRYFTSTKNHSLSNLEIRSHHHLFHTRSWKHLLPDAAPFLGGFAKAKLTSTSPSYLLRFIAETKRGEFSHWAQLLVITCFVAWNPWPANAIIVCYAVLSNLPCILNLRYTRDRLVRVLDKKLKKSTQNYSSSI